MTEQKKKAGAFAEIEQESLLQVKSPSLSVFLPPPR